MEQSIITPPKFSGCYWFWISNMDNDETVIDIEFAPYDIVTNQIIEENHKKEKNFFEAKIMGETYYITLDKNCFYQYIDRESPIVSKRHSRRIRHIRRAELEDNIRKNRFTDKIYSAAFNKQLIEYPDSIHKEQVRVKVSELFGDTTNNDNPFIFDPTNKLFNTEIRISNKLHQELKNEFYNKIKFNNLNEVKNYLKNEIQLEAHECTSRNKHQKLNSNFKEQADLFLQMIDQESGLSLEEKLLFLFSLEGFIYYSLNSTLKDSSIFDNKLMLYFVLMLASIQIYSAKNDMKVLSECCLNKTEGVYVFYRGAELPKSLLNELTSSEDKTDRYLVYNEFLSASYDIKNPLTLLKQGETEKGNIRVLMTYRLKKELVDKDRSIFCCLQNISNHPQEKEILFPPSSIFKMQKVYNQISKCDEIIFDFIPDNLNRNINGDTKTFSFSTPLNAVLEVRLANSKLNAEGVKEIVNENIANASLGKILIGENELGNEGAMAIADGIKKLKSLKEIDLFRNTIEVEGAIWIAEALKVNKTLECIRLDENFLGNEGAYAIAQALKISNSLQRIQMNKNRIGKAGAAAIADAIRVNKTLKSIDLSGNLIKDEGAIAIANALKLNSSLEIIELMANQIGNEGCAAILEALKTNKTIKKIDLQQNKIEDTLDQIRNFNDRFII